MKSKTLNKFFRYLFLLSAIVWLGGCQTQKDPKAKINRFEKDLFSYQDSTQGMQIDQLSAKYPRFFPIFTEHIIGIGTITDPNIALYLKQFTTDPVIREVFLKTQETFPKLNLLAEDIQKGLLNYEKLKGQNTPVALTTFISGFNQSFVSMENELAIGLDNYLGSECIYYKQLGLPAYIIERMEPQNLVADAIRAWIQSDLEESSEDQSLLDYIIFKGKILYAAKKVLGNKQELNVFAYTAEQLKWCKNHEKSMWQLLVEQNMLFSTDALMIQRLSKEAPFTRDFGLDSPPRAGAWLGYRIVEKFMARNKVSFNELLFNTNSKDLLARSGYRP